MIKQYKKKSVVIDAIQWDGHNLEEIGIFLGGEKYPVEEQKILIPTLGGIIIVSLNDFIVKGINGRFDIYKPDLFEKTYEEV